MSSVLQLVGIASMRAALATSVAQAGDVTLARVHILAGQMALAAARQRYSDEAAALPPIAGEELRHRP